MTATTVEAQQTQNELVTRADALRTRQDELNAMIDKAVDALHSGHGDHVHRLANLANQKRQVDTELGLVEQELKIAEVQLRHTTATQQRQELEGVFRELSTMQEQFSAAYLVCALRVGRYFELEERAITLMNELRRAQLPEPRDDNRLSRYALRDPRPKLLDTHQGNTRAGWRFQIPVVPLVAKFGR